MVRIVAYSVFVLLVIHLAVIVTNDIHWCYSVSTSCYAKRTIHFILMFCWPCISV